MSGRWEDSSEFWKRQFFPKMTPQIFSVLEEIAVGAGGSLCRFFVIKISPQFAECLSCRRDFFPDPFRGIGYPYVSRREIIRGVARFPIFRFCKRWRICLNRIRNLAEKSEKLKSRKVGISFHGAPRV